MAEISTKDAIKRVEAAFKAKQPWIDLLRDIYEFALPQRNTYTTRSKGAPRMERVFDSTAIHAVMRFGSIMQSNLFPPFQEWIDLNPGPLIPQAQQHAVASKLMEIRKKFFAGIHNSNFDQAMGEFLLDLATGTAGMLMLEGDDEQPFQFIAAPNATFAIDEGPGGTVDGVHRKIKMKVRNIVRQWRDAVLPTELAEKLKEDTEAEVDLSETTYFEPDTDGYRYRVMWRGKRSGSGEAEATDLVQRDYEEHPWIIGRWLKAPGEVWGRGPLMFALPDIKTANKVVELILKNASLAIAGVWAAADDGVINPNTIRIVPGAVIPVGQQGNLQPLEFGGRFDVAQLVLEDLRMNIKKIMFDQSLPPETGQPRSATEIIQRVKEIQQDIGSPFGRIMLEIVRPIVQRGLNIMHRKGIVELPVKVNGLTVQITATSPLAKLQSLNEIENVVRWVETSKALAGEQVSMLGIVMEELPKWLGLKFGVDPALIRPPNQRKQMEQMIGIMSAQNGGQIPIDAGGGGMPAPANQGGMGSVPVAA